VRTPGILGRLPLGVIADVAVAAVLMAANVAMFGRRPAIVPLLVAETAPVAVRGRWPLPALALAATAAIAGSLMGLPPSAPNFIGILWLLAAVASVHRARVSLPAALAIAAGTVFVVRDQDLIAIGFQMVLVGVAWSLGSGDRTRHALIIALRDLAASGERARHEAARRAAADERTSLAREVHDVVAHSLTVIVVQAGAGRRVAVESPEEAREALASIERAGREALGEIRRLLGALRSAQEDDRGWPQPSLTYLGDLVDRYRASGLEVEWSGAGALNDLPATIDLCAYRIVQEALTNCLRHARPASARVSVVRGEAGLVVEVANGAGAAPPASNGEGHGLAGMRDRVAVCHGDFAAGPLPDGGWRVWARLPLAGAGP
jgi:signal transduction histidine kinase